MTHHIYWWNLENLFDVHDSPTRPDYLQRQLKKELKGWTAEVLGKKIDNLCTVIKAMNNGNGPDILGVCEVESLSVLKKLSAKMKEVTGRTYKIMHHNTEDRRGIDIAMLYDEAMYTDDGKVYTLEVMKRSATRDLFQINLTTKEHQNELILIGNHWPSRMGGQYESEPYRMMVAETLSYWIDRIHEIKTTPNSNPAVILMGDFNDNPFDRSITEYLKATGNRERVKGSRSNTFYNPMFEHMGGTWATHVFGNEMSILDQFMVSKSFLVNSSKNAFKLKKTSLFKHSPMVKGKYNTPIRFSRPSKRDYNSDGFSDHLAIELIIEE